MPEPHTLFSYRPVLTRLSEGLLPAGRDTGILPASREPGERRPLPLRYNGHINQRFCGYSMTGPQQMKKIWYAVKLGHTRVTYAALVEMSGTNITMLTNNAAFPTPNPSLADLEKAKDRLLAAVEAYRFSHSRLDKQERDIAFEALKALRADLGAYVQTTCAGDKELITSAGFETEKAREPFGLLPAPGNVRVNVSPIAGSLELLFKGVKGRLSYQVSMCTGDPNVEANWNIVATTGKNRIVFNDLESNVVYYFRVVALGAAGWGAVSDFAKGKAA